jgi:multidrug resistance efflux pump
MLERSRGPAETRADQANLTLVSQAEAFWNGLSDAADDGRYTSAYLSAQCARISGALAGLVMLPAPAPGRSVNSTIWPERNPYVQELLKLAEEASRRKETVTASAALVSQPGQAIVQHSVILALPLGTSREPIGVIALALALNSPAAQNLALTADQLRWGAGWLEALPWAAQTNQLAKTNQRSVAALDLLAAMSAQQHISGMSVALINELAKRFECDRVSIGFVTEKGSIRLRAISHSADFKRDSAVADAIENAMEEAFDHRSAIVFPPLPVSGRTATMAHRALTRAQGSLATSVMSVPIANGDGRAIGVLTFESHRDRLFNVADFKLAEMIGSLVGPFFQLQLRNERLVSGKVAEAIVGGFTALTGPRRFALKLSTLGLVCLGVFLVVARGEHRITAKSVVEGEVQRAAVAPFDGFVRSATVRAGDTVRRGDTLATLEDRDLVLDQQRWRAERDKATQRHREALAKHERSNVSVLTSQIRQADSQLALAEEKLARTRIVAPFDGIVVSGDLSQLLGTPVEKGKILFELAPLDSYRVIIQVDERDIRYVSLHQKGFVALSGMPNEPAQLEISRITPVNVAEEGRNSFRVEARLVEPGRRLQPGMEGIAKIEAGQHPLIWVWTRSMVEWLRMVAWKYLP